MSTMRTTCPSCHAVFRVTPEQLEARAGQVRCGKCAFVFNAFDTLVTPIETVSLMAPVPEDETAQEPEELEAQAPWQHPAAPEVAMDAGVAEEHITIQPAPLTLAEPLTASFPLPTDEQIDREADEINRRIAASETSAVPRERKRRGAKADRPRLEITPDLQEKLQSLQQELSSSERRARWRTAGWGVGALVLCLTLAGQVAYFKRDWLAAHHPAAKPVLQTLCEVLRCRIGLLADAARIKLESSDLQTDPDHPDTVVLSASLRNLAPYPQAYPHLELTLTDANNQLLARRHFAPKDYLPKGARPDQGMPGNEELSVRLPLQLVGLNAVGYKLFVYYP